MNPDSRSRLSAFFLRPSSFRLIYMKRITIAALSLVAILLAVGCAEGAIGADPCAPAVVAAPCETLPRAQDQLWLVSDRSLGCADVDSRGTNLHYWRYEPGQGWQAAGSAAFFAADDPAMVTQLWIHGNRISHSYAFQVGWTAYSAIVRQTADPRPLRFVIWSWPSERIDGGPLEDVRVKADRAGPSALHLARFIDAFQGDVQVTITGYSFGARIATGALHVMNGGSLNGRRLAMQTASTRPRLDVALLAAALDSDWILPGHCHGQALGMVNRMLLVTNSCDQVLTRYHLLYGLRSCAEALGCTGLVGGNQLGAGEPRSLSSTPAAWLGRNTIGRIISVRRPSWLGSCRWCSARSRRRPARAWPASRRPMPAPHR